MVHFKLNLPKTRHLFLCNLKWYNFLPHPLPFIRCCVSLTILNIRSQSVQRGIQSSVQSEAINRSIWWHCSELAAVRVKWKLHIVKRQQRSDFTPWYNWYSGSIWCSWERRQTVKGVQKSSPSNGSSYPWSIYVDDDDDGGSDDIDEVIDDIDDDWW